MCAGLHSRSCRLWTLDAALHPASSSNLKSEICHCGEYTGGRYAYVDGGVQLGAPEGLVRHYARKTAGTPQRMRWELATRSFEYTWQADPAIDAPTEVFVPAVQYPNGLS
jgi:glycosyl hydrolase family 5